MMPRTLLGSRKILLASAVFAILFVAFALVKSRSLASAGTMPSVERVGIPPAPTDAVVRLDVLLAAYQAEPDAALRKYRHAPFHTQVEAVAPVRAGGWAEAVTVGGGRAILYFSESQASDPSIAAGEPGTFICADWQAGPSGTVFMYGCGAVPM